MSATSIIDVPWIGAVDLAGRWQRVSARQILADPGAWGTLHEAYPVRTIAAWRLVTAFYLACASTGTGIDDYADQWRDRLALRDTPRPFGQHLDLQEALDLKREKGEGRIVDIDLTRASGNAPLLWDHTTADQDVRYNEVEAVTAMLTLAAAGAAGRGTGVPGSEHRNHMAGPYMSTGAALPYATTVKTALEAIAEHFPPAEGDRPAWEWADDVFTPSRVPTVKTPAGVLEWLTWPVRAVLIDWDGPTAVGAVSTPGWKVDLEWPRADHDPFTLPRNDPKRPGAAISSMGPKKETFQEALRTIGTARPVRELRAWHKHTTEDGCDFTVDTPCTCEEDKKPKERTLPPMRPLPKHFNQMRETGTLRLRIIGQRSTQETQINGHAIDDLTFTPRTREEAT